MSLTKVLLAFRTALVVGLVSMLIWLLAEAESLRMERLRVEVAFLAGPESDKLVRLAPGQDFTGAVLVSVEGTNVRLDAMSSRLRRAIVLEPGLPGFPREPGRHAVTLRLALAAHEAFRDVTVTNVEPPTVVVIVDDLVDREAQVRVELPPGTIEGVPEPTPATVTVRLPQSAAQRITEDFHVIARVEPAALANLPEGRRTTIAAVTLEPPPAVREEVVRIAPHQASIALTLRSRTASTVVPSVPVHIRLAPTEIGVWDITLPAESRLLSDVTVTGPSDLIEAIRSERQRIVAFVPLSFEELERAAASGQMIEKEVVFSEAPTPLRFEPKQKTVRLQVKRREAAPVNGG